MRAVFRADASAKLGAGHLVRCLSFANALAEAGWDCTFAVRPESAEAYPSLLRNPFKVIPLSGDSEEETEELQERLPDGFDWMVLDHYERGLEFEQSCRGWARQIMVIDDLPVRQHHCDVLLDQTLGRQPSEYAHLVPNECRIATGSAYSLLRRGFGAWRTATLDRRRQYYELQRLVVSMGATDTRKLTALVLDGIEEAGLDLEVDVILGTSSPNIKAVQAKIEGMKTPAILHVDPPRIARLMADADLAIGAAGTSAWERCCLGLPSLVVTIAGNQRDIAKAISEAGTAKVIGDAEDLTPALIASELRQLHENPDLLTLMSVKAAAVCDGFGAIRASLPLQQGEPAKDGGEVMLRFARPEDETPMLEWQRDPSTRQFARESRVPTEREHRRWFQRRLLSETCFLTVIEHEREAAGVLRLDKIDRGMGSPAYEISILVAPAKRRLGIARAALNIARRWLPGIELVAEILPENQASLGLFQAAAYEPQHSGIFHNLPAARPN